MRILEDVNSKALIQYILTSKKGYKTTSSGDKKIDFVTASDDGTKQYGVAVRYRNIPCSETRSQVFEDKDVREIKDACGTDLIPTIAFAVHDEETKKTYAIIGTIEQMEKLADKEENTREFFYNVIHGMQIKFGVGRETKNDLLDKLKMNFDYTEIETNQKDFFN